MNQHLVFNENIKSFDLNNIKVFYLLNFLSKFIFEIAYKRPNDHPEDHVNRPSDSLSHKIMSRNIR